MPAAKVPVVSLRPPHFPRPSSPLSLHRNNLVTDDVKADKVQQLEKSEKKEQGFTVSVAALHSSLVSESSPQKVN